MEFDSRQYLKTSIFLSRVLRHDPDCIELKMDTHGWADVNELIEKMNRNSKHRITPEILEYIVAADDKMRFRFSDDGKRIKACQGHSIPWVEPEINYEPEAYPDYVYHGTTTEAMEAIYRDGRIRKMKRHAVHMHADFQMAWRSAARWHDKNPVLLKISTSAVMDHGIRLGVSDNEVWCAEEVPADCIVDRIYSAENYPDANDNGTY